MILGNKECCEEIAYFLKHGEYPQNNHKCTQSYTSSDREYDEKLYQDFIESNNYEWQNETTYKYALWH